MKMDPVCLVAGMLHDVIEDTHTTTELVRQDFGAEVARIVEGVTKISRIRFLSPEEQQAENFRKMVLAMVDDIRVVLVKARRPPAQHAHARVSSPDRRERIARETLEIYAPIAHRLGMGKIRGELEDLAFRHLEPEAFEDLKRTIESRRKVSDEFLAEVRAQVEAKMKEMNIPARVEGRVKRLYSIWQKLRRQQIPIEQVYDLLAIRIITDNVKNCYGALGSYSQHLAARPRPHQGFHRHPASQPLSVAAHLRHWPARPAL
jgi:guanosine-3',5'-bis(diphosphate) 3'-pyrophosphohydrolase